MHLRPVAPCSTLSSEILKTAHDCIFPSHFLKTLSLLTSNYEPWFPLHRSFWRHWSMGGTVCNHRNACQRVSSVVTMEAQISKCHGCYHGNTAQLVTVPVATPEFRVGVNRTWILSLPYTFFLYFDSLPSCRRRSPSSTLTLWWGAHTRGRSCCGTTGATRGPLCRGLPCQQQHIRYNEHLTRWDCASFTFTRVKFHPWRCLFSAPSLLCECRRHPERPQPD